MLGLSQSQSLLTTMPSRTKAIFPPSLESRPFLNRRNCSSILNGPSGKLVSSLVSSKQNISILDIEMISLKQIIFSFKELMLR